MYLHDPRSADLTPRHLRAEPISTDPLADVSATTQNGIDTCVNLWVGFPAEILVTAMEPHATVLLAFRVT